MTGAGAAGRTTVRRRVVVTGMGMITPVGRRRRVVVAGACARGGAGSGPITLFDAATLSHADRGRGLGGFRLADYRADADALARAQPDVAARPGRGDAGVAHAGLRRAAAGSGPVRGLPRLGRGAAGFRPLRRPGPPLEPMTAASTRRGSRASACGRCTRPARPSRSRADRPGTWRPSSGPGGRTRRARRRAPPVPRRSARRPS